LGQRSHNNAPKSRKQAVWDHFELKVFKRRRKAHRKPLTIIFEVPHADEVVVFIKFLLFLPGATYLGVPILIFWFYKIVMNPLCIALSSQLQQMKNWAGVSQAQCPMPKPNFFSF
jgi:hypothetical protein